MKAEFHYAITVAMQFVLMNNVYEADCWLKCFCNAICAPMAIHTANIQSFTGLWVGSFNGLGSRRDYFEWRLTSDISANPCQIDRMIPNKLDQSLSYSNNKQLHSQQVFSALSVLISFSMPTKNIYPFLSNCNAEKNYETLVAIKQP